MNLLKLAGVVLVIIVMGILIYLGIINILIILNERKNK